jgi:hypothetical protein
MEVEVTGQDVSRAFVLATAWRPDGDVAPTDAAISVSPRHGVPDQLVVAVAGYYGLTLRIDNEPAERSDEGMLEDLSCRDARTRDWYAWVDSVPTSPDELHAIGQAHVPNAGVDPVLTARPRSGDPTILLLDFRLLQRPGVWPPGPVWKPVRYDRVLAEATFRRLVVYCEDDVIADLAVDEVR